MTTWIICDDIARPNLQNSALSFMIGILPWIFFYLYNIATVSRTSHALKTIHVLLHLNFHLILSKSAQVKFYISGFFCQEEKSIIILSQEVSQLVERRSSNQLAHTTSCTPAVFCFYLLEVIQSGSHSFQVWVFSGTEETQVLQPSHPAALYSHMNSQLKSRMTL